MKDRAMKKAKAAQKRRSKIKRPNAAAKTSARKAAGKKSAKKVAAKKQAKRKLSAKRRRAVAKRASDPVELDSRDSFPASDPPSWVPVTGEGTPDRTGRKRRR